LSLPLLVLREGQFPQLLSEAPATGASRGDRSVHRAGRRIRLLHRRNLSAQSRAAAGARRPRAEAGGADADRSVEPRAARAARARRARAGAGRSPGSARQACARQVLMTRVLMTADAVGGVWTYALELARALVPHGLFTTLATMGPRPSEAHLAAARGIPGLDV